MRSKIRKQLRLVEPSIEHEHAKKLHAIRTIIAGHPEVIDLIYEDLIRGLREPEAGRDGMMTAEQVFKMLLIMQMNSVSYDTLRFHLMDSKCYRAFCGFGVTDVIPSDRTIQRDIKRIGSDTLEKINRVFVGVAKEKGFKEGARCASTVPLPKRISIIPPTPPFCGTVCGVSNVPSSVSASASRKSRNP